MANQFYQKTKIEATDGDTRVIVTIETINDSRNLQSYEMRDMRKGIADRIMVALPGRYFNPHLSDTKVKKAR